MFMEEQLQSHAQDTATSLGLSVSPYMAEEDLSTVKSMVDAIFDRGYYSRIKLLGTDGRTLLERSATIDLEGVPDWFVDLLSLDIPQANTEVLAGWNIAGVVNVESHPGYAYRQLWRTFTQTLFWLVLFAVAVGALGAFGIHAFLRPMRAVQRQAEGVSARNYIVQEELPRTRELRSMVIAMNRMTRKVQAMFEEQAHSAEQLREIAYQDSLTGLGNRRYFEAQLRSAVQKSEKVQNGALLMVRINGLKEINDKHGFKAGDDLIGATATVLEQTVRGGNSVIGRLAGADFGVILSGMDESRASEFADSLVGQLAQLHTQALIESSNVGHVGISFFEGGRVPAELMSEADHALRTAKSAGPNQWSIYRTDRVSMPSVGRQEWKKRIKQAIDKRSVVLYAQPVVASDDSQNVLHREVLLRIPAATGELWTAGTFMPVAEELNLARAIDCIVVEELLKRCVQGGAEHFAINLSHGSLRDEKFLDWLCVNLATVPTAAGKLVFEFSEFGVIHELEQLRRFSSRVRELGHGFALDHFGQAFSNFGHLNSLRPDYVKIDGAYTAQITENKDDQFFVKTLCGIAHSLDILAIAEMVESEEQWALLKNLQLDGVQGFSVGRPAAID
jgi:diguanylate cyclase (GGDEF)-like protein